jgi:hypothetical protein
MNCNTRVQITVRQLRSELIDVMEDSFEWAFQKTAIPMKQETQTHAEDQQHFQALSFSPSRYKKARDGDPSRA